MQNMIWIYTDVIVNRYFAENDMHDVRSKCSNVLDKLWFTIEIRPTQIKRTILDKSNQ